MAKAVELDGYANRDAPVPTRLEGDLAAGENVPKGGSKSERILVAGLEAIDVYVKTAATFQGTLSIDVIPVLADGDRNDDSVGTLAESNLAASTEIEGSDTEERVQFTVHGFYLVDVKLSMSDTAGDEADIAFVDVFGVPRR